MVKTLETITKEFDEYIKSNNISRITIWDVELKRPVMTGHIIIDNPDKYSMIFISSYPNKENLKIIVEDSKDESFDNGNYEMYNYNYYVKKYNLCQTETEYQDEIKELLKNAKLYKEN